MEDYIIPGTVFSPQIEIVKLRKRVAELEARLPKPDRYIFYVNVYESGLGNTMYSTEDFAKSAAKRFGYLTYGRYIKTAKIVIDA